MIVRAGIHRKKIRLVEEDHSDLHATNVPVYACEKQYLRQRRE